MPIARTAWTDDDGTGTTGTIINNAEKQLLYDQIDGFVVPHTPVYGAWTPTDLSGAGLVISGSNCWYTKIDRLVVIWGTITYPSTANTANAWMGGLPMAVGLGGAAISQGFGVHRLWRILDSPSSLVAYHPSTSLAVKNSDLSGAIVVLTASYLMPAV